jgi:hypothetical protein
MSTTRKSTPSPIVHQPAAQFPWEHDCVLINLWRQVLEYFDAFGECFSPLMDKLNLPLAA